QRAANRVAAASAPARSEPEHADPLDEDAYAPARAYGSASVPAPALVTGASVAPLWPEQPAASDATTEKQPAKKGRSRRYPRSLAERRPRQRVAAPQPAGAASPRRAASRAPSRS